MDAIGFQHLHRAQRHIIIVGIDHVNIPFMGLQVALHHLPAALPGKIAALRADDLIPAVAGNGIFETGFSAPGRRGTFCSPQLQNPYLFPFLRFTHHPAGAPAAFLFKVRTDKGSIQFLRFIHHSVYQQHRDASLFGFLQDLLPALRHNRRYDDHIHILGNELPHLCHLGFYRQRTQCDGQINIKFPGCFLNGFGTGLTPAAFLIDLCIANPDGALLFLQNSLLLILGHIIPTDLVASQNDLLGNSADVIDDIDGILDGLRSAGGTGDRCINDPLLYQLQAAVIPGKSVQSHDFDSLDPELFQGQVRTIGHIVVVRKDHIDSFQHLGLRQKGILGAVPGGIFQIQGEGLHIGSGNRFHKFRASAFTGKGIIFQFQNGAAGNSILFQDCQHCLSRLTSDQIVVRADKQRIIIPLHSAVQNDYRDLRIDLADDRRQSLHIAGRNDQQVNIVAHKPLHVCCLFLTVSRCIRHHQPDAVIFLCFCLQLVPQHQPPLLPQICQRHTDHIFDACLPGFAARKTP